jgi:sugar-specific transcriptional regulator TrmB
MSLKEFTKEVFSQYGFTEEDILVYLGYLKVPRATVSEVWMSLEADHGLSYEQVEEITKKLEENEFIKMVPGIIDRYIPLEPYFGLFIGESEQFRDEIAKIKDEILADQSKRFENLEEIQDKSINEVDTAVEAQIKAFFDDSDAKNSAKHERIENAKNRFTTTSKTLESDLHAIIEEDYSRLSDDVNKVDKDVDDVWDGIFSNLKGISESFVSDNEGAINNAKVNVTTIIKELLADFSERVNNLEKELKKDLDGHVERHKNIANELKPKMEQILEKYLERMNKVTTDLKEKISIILSEHVSHVKKTTGNLENNLHTKVDDKQYSLRDQTTTYKNTAITLLRNYIDSVNRFGDFSEDMAKQGLFFFGGKKKKYKARWAQVQEDVASISRTFEDEWTNIVDTYISDTQTTSNSLKNDVSSVVATENQTLDGESTDLDHKAQETIDAQLETLATDMAGEIDGTLQSGIKDCSDTTIKLKDSLENSLKTHHTQYDEAIERHKDDSLRHYTDFDTDIKRKNENFVGNSSHEVTGVKTKQRQIYDELLTKIRSDFNNSKSNSSEKIDAEISVWNGESADMNTNLTNMLEDHRTKYKENAETLQNSLNTTTKDTNQNIKDAVADFTLAFMNSIDDSTEKAEGNEEKLKDIHSASKNIPEYAKITTWTAVGRTALINAIKDAIYRVKSSIIIVTPTVIPEVLQLCSQWAFTKKAARFMLTSTWDLNVYGDIIQKMKALGNIQFRQLNTAGDYYAITRDAEEVILAPAVEDDAQLISIISNQPLISKLYSQFIGPIFQANSRPLK